MRIAIAQINTTPGALRGNQSRAVAAWQEAAEKGSDLVLFPEMTLTGYPAKDLLTRSGFVAESRAAAESFAHQTAEGPPSLIGFAEAHEGVGTRVYNAAAFCRSGRIEVIHRKWLLPTYDVFDEDRYFDEGTEATLIEVAGFPIGVTICEDIWNDELYWTKRLYPRDPVAESVRRGAQLIVNLSASPFSIGKPAIRRRMLCEAAKRHRVPIVMCNLVGGNDDLIFDGGSLVITKDGVVAQHLPSFEEGLQVVDPETTNISPLPEETDEKQVVEALVLGIRDYLHKTGFSKVMIGLSGGIDSAIVAVLAVRALGPENVSGVLMPSRYSSDHSVRDAKALADNLGIAYRVIPIEPGFAAMLEQLGLKVGEPATKLAIENLQSRIRGVTMMTLSNATGALVLTTGNKSEVAVGYCTLYGDMCGGLAVIADVPKTLVYTLSRWLNEEAGRELIPESTLSKAPSAELAPGQKDTDSLPPYEVLDPILDAYVVRGASAEEIIEQGFDEKTVRRVLRLVDLNEYKRRQSAPTLKVTDKAFGYGWRMPIARGS